MDPGLQQLVTVVLSVMGACIVVALVGLLLLVRQIRQLRVPRDADYFTTMRLIPVSLVILLDMLDFGMDIFATPIVWIVLDRMGLPNLRNKAAIEALIPFSSPIPTFTLSWIAARMFNLGSAEMNQLEQVARYRQRGARIIDMDERR